MKTKTKQSDKMIQFRGYFWRPDSQRFRSTPKHANDSGVVYVWTNKTHGIKRVAKGRHFHSITELTDAVAKALRDAGITLHPSRETRKLFEHNGN